MSFGGVVGYQRQEERPEICFSCGGNGEKLYYGYVTIGNTEYKEQFCLEHYRERFGVDPEEFWEPEEDGE